jgi:hypothetical protein
MEFIYGNLQNGIRQYDMPLALSKFYTIPSIAPGRLMADDFIYLSWKGSFDPSKYNIVVESMDNAGTRWRNIGQAKERVQLPFVKFDPYAKVGVVPTTDTLPLFSALLVRGATYIIPDVGSMNGRFQMERLGGKF